MYNSDSERRESGCEDSVRESETDRQTDTEKEREGGGSIKPMLTLFYTSEIQEREP